MLDLGAAAAAASKPFCSLLFFSFLFFLKRYILLLFLSVYTHACVIKQPAGQPKVQHELLHRLGSFSS